MASDAKHSGEPAARTGKPPANAGKVSRANTVVAPSRTMVLGGLVVATLVVGTVGGLMVAKWAGGPRPASAATPDGHASGPEHALANQPPPSTIEDKYAYVELEPVIVNLDEHRLMRYVRAIVILELDATNKRQVQQTIELVERRKLVLRNRLTLFLAGRTPEEVRGDKALRHLERKILDDFNRELWPDQKGNIHDVMFKEFAVQ